MRKSKKLTYLIKDAKAARAIYNNAPGELHKLSLSFTTFDGDVIEFELDYHTATDMLNQAIAAHSVINRPLKIPRNNPFG